MVKTAVAEGWLENDKVVAENLRSFKRTGADIMPIYFAKEAVFKGLQA